MQYNIKHKSHIYKKYKRNVLKKICDVFSDIISFFYGMLLTRPGLFILLIIASILVFLNK